MTRPSFRDVTYVGSCVINGIVLGLNLGILVVRRDAVSSICVLAALVTVALLVRTREWADAWRATQHAEQRKLEVELQVAQAMLAHIQGSKSLTLGIETPRAERRH